MEVADSSKDALASQLNILLRKMLYSSNLLDFTEVCLCRFWLIQEDSFKCCEFVTTVTES